MGNGCWGEGRWGIIVLHRLRMRMKWKGLCCVYWEVKWRSFSFYRSRWGGARLAGSIGGGKDGMQGCSGCRGISEVIGGRCHCHESVIRVSVVDEKEVE